MVIRARVDDTSARQREPAAQGSDAAYIFRRPFGAVIGGVGRQYRIVRGFASRPLQHVRN
jgi:hypothetical protein